MLVRGGLFVFDSLRESTILCVQFFAGLWRAWKKENINLYVFLCYLIHNRRFLQCNQWLIIWLFYASKSSAHTRIFFYVPLVHKLNIKINHFSVRSLCSMEFNIFVMCCNKETKRQRFFKVVPKVKVAP